VKFRQRISQAFSYLVMRHGLFYLTIQLQWMIRFFLYPFDSWYGNVYSEIIADRITYSEAKNRLKETNITKNIEAVHL
jgi:hypothetical protein